MNHKGKNFAGEKPAFNLRLTHAEREIWQAAARHAGLSALAFARRALIDQSFKILAKPPQPQGVGKKSRERDQAGHASGQDGLMKA